MDGVTAIRAIREALPTDEVVALTNVLEDELVGSAILSAALLERHKYYKRCPTLVFANTREEFQMLTNWIRDHGRLDRSAVLMEMTGHYHRALEQYLHEAGVEVY